MAWPKLRNRRSPGPSATASDASGSAADRNGSQADGNGSQADGNGSRADGNGSRAGGRPSWRAAQAWLGNGAAADPDAAPAPDAGSDTGPGLALAPAPVPAPAPAEADETAGDPGDGPSFFEWTRVEHSSGLDDTGNGVPDDGSADNAAADVPPRPRRTWEPVVTPVEDTREPQAEGIGQHLGSLAHLSANPRMQAWQRRAIIAVIAGLVFGILLHDWRWGLTFAVLAAIADTIYRSRTTFNGPAGVRLTGAQKRTVRQLSGLERKGYRAMHCLPIPDSDEQIDHLVIGPAGVFAIDSESWDKRTPVRTRSHRNLWHGSYNMQDRLEHAHWESKRAAELLSAATGSPVTVHPAMAVYGPPIPFDVATIGDVDVFSGAGLRKYLRRRGRKNRAQQLSASQIERIDKAAHQVFGQDPAS